MAFVCSAVASVSQVSLGGVVALRAGEFLKGTTLHGHIVAGALLQTHNVYMADWDDGRTEPTS